MPEFDPRKDPAYLQGKAALETARNAGQEQNFSDKLQKSKPLSHWLWNLPDNITVGTIDAVLNTVDFAMDVTAGDQPKPGTLGAAARDAADTISNKVLLTKLRDSLAAESNQGDEMTQAVAQFLVPFTGWSKLMGGLKGASALGTAGRVVAAESATAATALAPHDVRIADLAAYARTLDNKIGDAFRKITPDGSLANAYINYMTSRSDESVAEGRFKNAVDNLVAVGLVTTAIKSTAIGVKTGRKLLDEAAKSGEETARVNIEAAKAAAKKE